MHQWNDESSLWIEANCNKMMYLSFYVYAYIYIYIYIYTHVIYVVVMYTWVDVL